MKLLHNKNSASPSSPSSSSASLHKHLFVYLLISVLVSLHLTTLVDASGDDYNTDNSNNYSSNQQQTKMKQPPPFSPSLEHLIHTPIDFQKAKNDYSKSFSNTDGADNTGEYQKQSTPSKVLPLLQEQQQHQEVPLRGGAVASMEVDDPGALRDYDSIMDGAAMCPPELPSGHLKWRKGNRVITATLPHLASESCRAPFKCSVSTTVHRRVFLQDGDTLQVILQSSKDSHDIMPTTTTSTTTTTTTTTTSSSSTSTTTTPTSSTTIRTAVQSAKPTSKKQQNKPNDRHFPKVRPFAALGAHELQQSYGKSSSAVIPPEQLRSSSDLSQQQSSSTQVSNIQKASPTTAPPWRVASLSELTGKSNRQQKIFKKKPESHTHESSTKSSIYLTEEEAARDSVEVDEVGSSHELVQNEKNTGMTQEGLSASSQEKTELIKNDKSVGSPSRTPSSEDHRLNVSPERVQPLLTSGRSNIVGSDHQQSVASIPTNRLHTVLLKQSAPPVGSTTTINDITNEHLLSKEDDVAGQRGSTNGSAVRSKRSTYDDDTPFTPEQHHDGGIYGTSLTLWKVTVSEWVSCSTREGGQVAQSNKDGVATILPRHLQPGTTYFIGRSSWSSSECFKLQVTVRSAECGEGSLCSGKGVCHANSSMEHYRCSCCPQYMGSHCEERDGCAAKPCQNDGMCVDIQEGHAGECFQCLCPYGYTGRLCESPINLCESDPCKNGGTCQGNHSMYSCSCPIGWTGPQCTQPMPTQPGTSPSDRRLEQTDSYYLKNPPDYSRQGQEHYFERVPEGATISQPADLQGAAQITVEESYSGNAETCKDSPCVHGICVDTSNSFKCYCTPGFGGIRCEFEYDECESNPCYNGGTCLDHIGSFQCICGKGYYGNRCQVKVDMCSPNPCPMTRVCVDKGNTYSCECFNGAMDDDCEPHTKVCDSNPCQNGGTCRSLPESWSFFCACRPGFVGGTCEDISVLQSVGSMGTLDPPMPHEERPPPPLSTLPFGDVHSVYIAAAVLSAALLIFALVVGACHCRVNRTYRKCFSAIPGGRFTPINRKNRNTTLIDKAWLLNYSRHKYTRGEGVLRLDADCDGSSLPMTAHGGASAENLFYNMDVCDNQELPLIK